MDEHEINTAEENVNDTTEENLNNTGEGNVNNQDQVVGTATTTLDHFVATLYAKYERGSKSEEDSTPPVSPADINQLEKRLLEREGEETKRTIERGVKLLTLLRSQLNEQQKNAEPKPKFKFTRRNAPAADAPITSTPSQNSVDLKPSCQERLANRLSNSSSSGICLKSRSNETIVFGPGSLNGTDVTMEELDNCVIIANDNIGALRGHKIYKSFIIATNIESSAILYTVKQSLFMIRSLQLRIHETQSAIFLCSTRSPPIIEKSDDIRFGHLPLSPLFNGDDQHKEIEVKDFNWHRQTEKSPNWQVLGHEIVLDIEGELTVKKNVAESSSNPESNSQEWMITTQNEAKLRKLFDNLGLHPVD